jgi:hypothetical protein
MAFIKFIITALAATTAFTSVLANLVPAPNAVTTTSDTIAANHLEKRVCNQYGCGMKCKGTANTPCSMTALNSFADCEICAYFSYDANGNGVCLHIPTTKLYLKTLLIMICIDKEMGQ